LAFKIDGFLDNINDTIHHHPYTRGFFPNHNNLQWLVTKLGREALRTGHVVHQVQQRHDPPSVLHHGVPPHFLHQGAGELLETSHGRERDRHAPVSPDLEEQ
jgi:hypothetical protein